LVLAVLLVTGSTRFRGALILKWALGVTQTRLDVVGFGRTRPYTGEDRLTILSKGLSMARLDRCALLWLRRGLSRALRFLLTACGLSVRLLSRTGMSTGGAVR